MSAMVDSALTTIPRAPRAALISRSVIPAWRNTMARRTSACASRSGRRAPPILAGAVRPVRRTRCISLMAADALTAKRRAACRIELPPSTARTIRSRKSWDKGAVMINSTALTPSTLGIRTPDSVQARTALERHSGGLSQRRLSKPGAI